MASALHGNDLAQNSAYDSDMASALDVNFAQHGNEKEQTLTMDLDMVSDGDHLAEDGVAVNLSSLQFQCGKSFSSITELEAAIKHYEKEHFAVLIKAKGDKWPEGHRYRETLLYKYLVFYCKNGKKQHKSVAKGMRPNASSGKLGCHFKIKVSASHGLLVVKEATLSHTQHELSEERFLHLPEQLRLTPEEAKEAELVLKTGGNKKKLQAHLIAQRGGKPVTLRTLYNLYAKVKKKESAQPSDLCNKVEAISTRASQVEMVRKSKTECQKFSEACKLTSNISSVLSTMSNDKYNYYLEKLRMFHDLMSNEKLMNIEEISGETQASADVEDLPAPQVQNLSTPQVQNLPAPHFQNLAAPWVQNLPAPQVQNLPALQLELTASKLPKPLKKNRNSKGFGKTVIGLHRGKKRKQPATTQSGIYINKSPNEKDKSILQMVVEPEVVESAISGVLLTEDKVNVIPRIVPMQCLRDERINIETVRKELKGDCVQCDLCLNWYNQTCQGAKFNPQSKYWFCSNCRQG